MIIKNQMGTRLSILENNDTIAINYDKQDKVYVIAAYNGGSDSCTELGYYSLQEQALEILNLICEKYQYCQECKCGNIGIQTPEFVFEMPTDKILKYK